LRALQSLSLGLSPPPARSRPSIGHTEKSAIGSWRVRRAPCRSAYLTGSQFRHYDTKGSAFADIPSEHLDGVSPELPCHTDSIKSRTACEKAGVADFTNGSPQMRTDDIEQWIACPARQCQQRYLLANDIPTRARSLFDDAFRDQNAQNTMRRRASELGMHRNFCKSQASLAGSRQNAQHCYGPLNALRSTRQISGRSVGSGRTAMTVSHETRLAQQDKSSGTAAVTMTRFFD